MQTIAAQLDGMFRTAIREAFGLDADPLVGAAQNEKFGDYQSNAAMGLAKQVAERTGQKTNPRAVAEQIKAKATPLLGDMAAEVSIAGPGFINVRLSPGWLARQLRATAGDERAGAPLAPAPQTVVVDYSAPNIAKELHVGHLRSTIIGDAVSRVLEFQGQHVIRQNHIGDWGTQFGMLISHLRSLDAGHESGLEDLEAFYVKAKQRWKDDEGFAAEARQTVVKLQAGEPDELRLWHKIIDETRKHYQPIYDRLKVKLGPANERGESFYNPFLAEVVRELKDKGIAVESEGAVAVFTEGDASPIIIEKSGDGGYGYATTDLAAVRFRVKELGAKRVIYFVDARQSQHFRQVFDAARRAGWAEGVLLEHAAFGTMYGEDGKPFATSKGGVSKLKELLDVAEQRAFDLVSEKSPELPEGRRREIGRTVGIGAVKYFDLSKDRTSDYAFSFDAMLALNGNTAPYMQYAHARVRSIFREAAKRGIAYAGPSAAEITLESPYELALARQVLRLGEVVDLVARELKPHHLCSYLYDLAGRFSGFFENCPVLQSDEATRQSRLALCDVVARTLAVGLDLLGIEHPEQM